MEKRTKRVLTEIKEYIVILFGMFIYTLGWVFFLIPNGLVGGGVTGISAVIYYTTGFPVSYSFFLMNGLLLAIALKILGKTFGVKTVFAIIAGTIFLRILPDLIPSDLIQNIAIDNGKLLSAIIGGGLAGAGIAINFTQGGSTGGTDIIALMINKYRNMSPGRLILMMDVIIVASSLIIPTEAGVGQRVAIIIYGFILISVTGYTVDMVISGAQQSVQMFIFSHHHDAIANRITSIGRGVTVIDSMGWFTKEEGKILMTVVRKAESSFVFKAVKEIDKKAFISVSNATGVYGQGFEAIKK
ncbi:MAG: YitT family protein [Bacteroidales bacterium]